MTTAAMYALSLQMISGPPAPDTGAFHRVDPDEVGLVAAGRIVSLWRSDYMGGTVFVNGGRVTVYRWAGCVTLRPDDGEEVTLCLK